MPTLCGVPMPEHKRMCRENWIAARKRRETEHDYLMRTNADYRTACLEEDNERKERVEVMSKKSSSERVTRPVVGDYKGHPTLTLPNGSKHGFTFGLRKAQAILEHLDAIRAFVGKRTEEQADKGLASYERAGLGEDQDFCPSDSEEAPF